MIQCSIDDIISEIRSKRYRDSNKLKSRKKEIYSELCSKFRNNGFSKAEYKSIADKLSGPLAKTLDRRGYYHSNDYNNGRNLQGRIAETLYIEADLLKEIGLTKNQIKQSLPKISVYETDELKRKYSKVVFSATLKSSNPGIEKAEMLQRKYDETRKYTEQYANEKGCSIAGTITSAAFRSSDNLGAAKRYIDNYNAAIEHLIKNKYSEKEAKSIAAKNFRAKNVIETLNKKLNIPKFQSLKPVSSTEINDFIEQKYVQEKVEEKLNEEFELNKIKIAKLREELRLQKLQRLKDEEVKSEIDVFKAEMKVSEYKCKISLSQMETGHKINIFHLGRLINATKETGNILIKGLSKMNNLSASLNFA